MVATFVFRAPLQSPLNKRKAQRQAAIKAEQERIVAQQAEAQRQAAIKAEQERIVCSTSGSSTPSGIKAERERILAQQAKGKNSLAAEKSSPTCQKLPLKPKPDDKTAIRAEQRTYCGSTS